MFFFHRRWQFLLVLDGRFGRNPTWMPDVGQTWEAEGEVHSLCQLQFAQTLVCCFSKWGSVSTQHRIFYHFMFENDGTLYTWSIDSLFSNEIIIWLYLRIDSLYQYVMAYYQSNCFTVHAIFCDISAKANFWIAFRAYWVQWQWDIWDYLRIRKNVNVSEDSAGITVPQTRSFALWTKVIVRVHEDHFAHWASEHFRSVLSSARSALSIMTGWSDEWSMVACCILLWVAVTDRTKSLLTSWNLHVFSRGP